MVGEFNGMLKEFNGMLKGFYNENSAAQSSVVKHCSSLLQQAASEVPLNDGDQALLVAEWGCSHGGNSIAPVLLLCRTLQQRMEQGSTNNRSHCRPLQVHVSHTDVISNDWAALFQCAEQYVKQVHSSCPELHVTYAGVGSSMYRRNYPSCSLDLGFTFSTLHWLSQKPLNPKHAINPGSSKMQPDEHEAFTQQAICDLKLFLMLRAEEFKPGGLLVLTYVGCHDDSTAPVTTWAAHYHEAVQQVADAMVSDGLLQAHEPGLMAPPVFFLDHATQQQVFGDVSDAWELLHFDTLMAINPISEAWKAGDVSVEENAQAYVNFYKAVAQPCFEAGLKQAGRTEKEVCSLVEELFVRLTKAAVVNPVCVEFPCTRVLLRRHATCC